VGDVRSGFTFYSMTKIFKPEKGNRKKEIEKRISETTDKHR